MRTCVSPWYWAFAGEEGAALATRAGALERERAHAAAEAEALDGKLQAARAACPATVGRCRLTVSKLVLKAPTVSGLEAGTT
jgi:hypothetical protein